MKVIQEDVNKLILEGSPSSVFFLLILALSIAPIIFGKIMTSFLFDFLDKGNILLTTDLLILLFYWILPILIIVLTLPFLIYAKITPIVAIVDKNTNCLKICRKHLFVSKPLELKTLNIRKIRTEISPYDLLGRLSSVGVVALLSNNVVSPTLSNNIIFVMQNNEEITIKIRNFYVFEAYSQVTKKIAEYLGIQFEEGSYIG